MHHAKNRGNKEIPLAILSRILAQLCVTLCMIVLVSLIVLLKRFPCFHNFSHGVSGASEPLRPVRPWPYHFFGRRSAMCTRAHERFSPCSYMYIPARCVSLAELLVYTSSHGKRRRGSSRLRSEYIDVRANQ